MSETSQTSYLESRWSRVSAACLAAGTFALAGCSNPVTIEKTSAAETAAGLTAPGASATLVFDTLGGGSSIIRVYRGYESDAPEDKAPNDTVVTGTYNDGDESPAECRTTGRTVSSDTTVGEEARTSDQWVRLAITGPEPQYATAVYVENPDALLAQLPEC